MEIKGLGSGCSKCRSTIGVIERAAQASDKSVLAAGTLDPLLAARLVAERKQIKAWPKGLPNACSRFLG